MTGEREPTVIERMAEAYLRKYISLGDLGAATEAMLAAMQELQKASDVKFGDDCLVVDDMTRAEASIWLRVVIRQHDTKQSMRDHERRAGGKGE